MISLSDKNFETAKKMKQKKSYAIISHTLFTLYSEWNILFLNREKKSFLVLVNKIFKRLLK